jgi:peroxiredoxin Q/BCP
MSELYLLNDGQKKSLEELCQQAEFATLLYFYPKDMTSACTKQAEMFRDQYNWFQKKGINIVGVSRDSLSRHNNFIDKYDLPFPLIADVDERLCNRFNVIAEKSMYGRKYLGIVRSTFFLDRDTSILEEWRSIKVSDHMRELKHYIVGVLNNAE